MVQDRRLRRRTLLAGGAATLLHACAGQLSPDPAPDSAPTRSTPDPVSGPAPVPTIDDLLADQFVVAHRGSGDNWPEHTLTAYLNATISGADAIEISVRSTSDGVLVCHHDADTRRVTGVEGEVAALTFAQLRERPVDARRWLGGATAPEPISPVVDVLAALPEDALVFIEDKDGTNTMQLLEILDSQPRSTERFVWKQWAFAKQVESARSRGYRSWGYLTSDTLGRVEEAFTMHDALGVPVGAADEDISRLVDTGKPVMAWEVHTRSERRRLRSLGVTGLMCSNVPYVLEKAKPATSDSFSSGRRPAGDLPANYLEGWASQPPLQPREPSLILSGGASPRYLLGSLCPVAAGDFELTFTVGWEAAPDGAHSRAGVAFGLVDDSPYHPRQPNAAGAYQAFLNSDGRVALAYQAAAWSASENLTTLDRVSTGEVEITVTVEKQKISISADGNYSSVNHMDARGGYLWLWGEQVSQGARFSGIHVTQL